MCIQHLITRRDITEELWRRVPLFHGGHFDARYSLWQTGTINRTLEDARSQKNEGNHPPIPVLLGFAAVRLEAEVEAGVSNPWVTIAGVDERWRAWLMTIPGASTQSDGCA